MLREVAGDAATYIEPGLDAEQAAVLVMQRLRSDTGAALRRRVQREYAWPLMYRRHLLPLLQEAIDGRASALTQGRVLPMV